MYAVPLTPTCAVVSCIGCITGSAPCSWAEHTQEINVGEDLHIRRALDYVHPFHWDKGGYLDVKRCWTDLSVVTIRRDIPRGSLSRKEHGNK